MPNYGGSSSSSTPQVTQPIISTLPINTETAIETRGRSRERTPRNPEDEIPSVSVKRRISTIEKKAKAKAKASPQAITEGEDDTKEEEPKSPVKKEVKKTEKKSPDKKAVKKDTTILKKERAKSEPAVGGNILNNIQKLSEALNDLYRKDIMTKSQKSEYLKLKDMLKPG